MIFYFSGTGNSLYIAKDIANNQNEELVSIAKQMNCGKEIYEYELGDNENRAVYSNRLRVTVL